MHIHTLDKLRHDHDFAYIHEKGETRVRQVLVLTILTMIAEITAGAAFGSMALLADGWHMGTHATAFAITIFAYWYSKKHAADKRFTFGTGKVSALGGFASAVTLAGVALLMTIESILRLFHPQRILFNEAIAVAVLGLTVNLICAVLLNDHHGHGHGHDHDHPADHPHHHADHNIRGAYLHVIADALTSVLAIAALISGKYFGWNRLDPVIGIVGAIVISRWALGLVKDTSIILLDHNLDSEATKAVREKIESDSDNRISDMHVWKVGPADYAAMISVVTHFPKNPEYYKNLLSEFTEITHVTVEVNQCTGESCMVSRERKA
ncbi:MAG: CDF family Co(II)/Ni(II) efflux transporter DmeF [Desulfosalsimonadaceae bacterium]|nr:CDF family Co(II)/Ni(II) efflux transporter DmeF [Desulfosalsimonadaceae bacterium]